MVDARDDERETPGAASTDGVGPALGGPAGDAPPHPWGPPLLDSDSWETVPLANANRAYAGRRRAGAVTNRRWLVVGAVLAGLAAVIAIPLVLTSGGDRGDGVAAPTRSAPLASRSFSATSTTTLSSTGEAASTSSPPSSTNTGPARTTTTRPTTSKAQPPPPPAFQPLTFEGERADLDGSAAPYQFDGASGGQVAYRIGDWDDRAGDGVLTIRNIAIPTTGRYRIALFTVHPDGESQRFGRLTVTGVNVITLTFNGGSTCCQTTNVDVDLTAGSKTLTFTHSNRRAPSVDRIVISRL